MLGVWIIVAAIGIVLYLINTTAFFLFLGTVAYLALLVGAHSNDFRDQERRWRENNKG